MLFDPATSFFEKNLLVLATTEQKLVNAIRNGSSTLATKLKSILESPLNVNLIDTNTTVSGAREGVVKKVNELIGSNITNAEFVELEASGIISQQASRGSIFEHFVRKNAVSIFGTDVVLRVNLFQKTAMAITESSLTTITS